MADTNIDTLVKDNGQFRRQLAELAELQSREKARQEAEAEKLRKETAAAKAAQESAMAQLLQLQVADAEMKAKRDKMMNRLLSALLGVATVGSGGGIWAAVRDPTPEVVKEATEPVKQAIDQKLDQIDRRSSTNVDKVNRLRDEIQDQQIQMSDGFDVTFKKIDALESRKKSASSVPIPNSLTDGKTKADAIRSARAKDNANKTEEQLADPFFGLPR